MTLYLRCDRFFMVFHTVIDKRQDGGYDGDKVAKCPTCGHILFAVESIYRFGIFRYKCRWCKKYVRVMVKEDTEEA